MSASTVLKAETPFVVAVPLAVSAADAPLQLLPTGAPGAVITGTEGNDQGIYSLIGTANDDTIIGLGGDDFIDGDAGDDQISVRAAGGYGDTVHGGSGTDTLAVQLDVAGGINFDSSGPVGHIKYVSYNSSLADILLMKTGSSFKLGIGNYAYAGVAFDGIENLGIQAFDADQQDLLVVFGQGSYDGGAGIDTFFADWSAAGWPVVWNNLAAGAQDVNGSSVANERLQFDDRHVALDMDGAAGMTAKLLGAVFGASYVNNPEFVGIGLSVFDAGLSYEQVAQLALDARLGAGHTHQQAVELMYFNLMGVAPSPQDSAELVALIDVYHVFTEASIAVFAAELPYNTANIDLVGLTQTGIEFVPA